MDKISIDTYFALLINPESTDELIAEYSIIQKGNGGFNFNLAPNPEKVEITDEDIANEDAMRIGNGLARWRRYQKFKKKRNSSPNQKIIISEGDSWFQFPVIINDVIDHLNKNHIMRSLGAAGDTLSNMVDGPTTKNSTEYMTQLLMYKDHVGAFLFSGAGNDIIGEDLDTGEPVLSGLLNQFNGDITDKLGHINSAELKLRLDLLKVGYTKLIQNIRAENSFKNLPLIFHGYDYVIPYPAVQGEHRKPIYAKKDQWLGKSMKDKNITEPNLQTEIMKSLINSLYDMLFELERSYANIHIIDCRGAVSGIKEWADEIHPTSDGFQKIATLFNKKIMQLKLNEHQIL